MIFGRYKLHKATNDKMPIYGSVTR